MNAVRQMAIFAVAGVLPLIATIAISAQSPTATEELQMLQEQLRRAHVAGDAAAYLDDARRMHDFLNGSPASILQLMSAEAFAEHTEDALRSLTQFIRMSQSNEDVLKAKQFDALRESPQYSKIHEGMIANMASISAASKAFTLSHEALIPEDIDYDRATKRFYISSVISKKIFAIDMNGRSTVFATSPDKWPMMALKVDEQRHLLWATEVAIDGFVFSPQKDWGRSAVLVYDLRSGKLRHRIEGPAHAALGDMTLTADGDVVVSDGDHGGIYRVSRTGETITRLDTGDFISPQTAAISADGLHLFVPDYLRGIGILDLKTKHVSWIPMEGRYALNGIDGLYLSGRTLIGTQNGASPERVIRFELDPSLSHVMSESIIERATPTLGDPTHGVIVGRDFYYIANSGWDALDDHGNVKPGRIMPEAIVMRARAF